MPTFNLHNAIMNLPAAVPGNITESSPVIAYKLGHRDARHAAAEAALTADSCVEELEHLLDTGFAGGPQGKRAREALSEFNGKASPSLSHEAAKPALIVSGDMGGSRARTSSHAAADHTTSSNANAAWDRGFNRGIRRGKAEAMLAVSAPVQAALRALEAGHVDTAKAMLQGLLETTSPDLMPAR